AVRRMIEGVRRAVLHLAVSTVQENVPAVPAVPQAPNPSRNPGENGTVLGDGNLGPGDFRPPKPSHKDGVFAGENQECGTAGTVGREISEDKGEVEEGEI